MKYCKPWSWFLLLLPLLACGCVNVAKLPLVTSERFEYTRSNPLSSAHIVAENVVSDESTVHCDSLIVEAAYPIVGSVTVTVTNATIQKVKP